MAKCNTIKIGEYFLPKRQRKLLVHKKKKGKEEGLFFF